MANNVTPTNSSSFWTESQDISRNRMLDSTKSESTIDDDESDRNYYSTSSSEDDENHDKDDEVISAVTSHGTTSSGCNITQTMGVTRDLEIMRPEHDLARDDEEAIQTTTQQTLNAVIEAIHILTRQLKKTSDAPSSSAPAETMTTTHHDNFIQASPQEEHKENSSNRTGPPAQIVRKNQPPNNYNTGPGSIVAAYATTDTWRFSDIVKQLFTSSSSSCPERSKIGSCLIALDDACRSLEQKAKWMSDESSMILQDLQQAQAELNEVDFRCHRAEKCAKQLYKQNLVLKKELEKSKAEKRVLVREIRALIGEKEDREAFQKRLVENMKAHEDIMIEQTGSLSSKRNEGVGELGDTAGEVEPETKNTDNDEGTQQSRIENATIDRTTTTASNSRFNPFGKLFQSFSGSMEITDTKEKLDTLQSGPTAAAQTGSTRDHIPTTPNTNHSTIYSPAAQLSITEDSPTLSTILEASQSIGSEYSYDTPPVLQLTPTLSSCDSMKSVLSASDLLNSNDDGEEFNQNNFRESNSNRKTVVSHRKKGSSASSSTWVRQVNGVNSSTISSSTQKTVISVKLPRKNITRQSTGINSRNTNTNNASNGVITRSMKESDDKRTTKQFRLYTIS